MTIGVAGLRTDSWWRRGCNSICSRSDTPTGSWGCCCRHFAGHTVSIERLSLSPQTTGELDPGVPRASWIAGTCRTLPGFLCSSSIRISGLAWWTTGTQRRSTSSRRSPTFWARRFPGTSTDARCELGPSSGRWRFRPPTVTHWKPTRTLSAPVFSQPRSVTPRCLATGAILCSAWDRTKSSSGAESGFASDHHARARRRSSR